MLNETESTAPSNSPRPPSPTNQQPLSNRLPPIRTPFSQYWREFRISVLPPVVFVVILGAVVLLWRQSAINTGVTGVGEGVRSQVSSAQAGLVQQLRVQPYQLVRQGDPIAVIVPQDPRAKFDLLQSELQLARIRLQPSLAEGNAMNYEGIRVDLLRVKSELAVAKVNLERALNDVRRNEPLYKEKLVSEEIFDLSLKTRDMLKAEIDEKTRAIADIERRMESLRSLGEPGTVRPEDITQATVSRLESLQQAAATNVGPIILYAPITGMITSIYRNQGESVVEGEPLVTISSQWSERVIGYLRQPYPLEPRVGMKVLVSARDPKRTKFLGEISQIGAQMEIITNSLAFIRQGSLVDAGLPIIVDVPSGTKIRPGEAVDMMIQTSASPVIVPAAPAAPSSAGLARSRNQP